MDRQNIPDRTIGVCKPTTPYGGLFPAVRRVMFLAWHVSMYSTHDYVEPRSILLSDLGQGDPPLEEVVKVISHEELHDILEQVVGTEVSARLDSLVDDGDFVVDRPENHVVDDRPPKEQYADRLQVGAEQ